PTKKRFLNPRLPPPPTEPRWPPETPREPTASPHDVDGPADRRGARAPADGDDRGVRGEGLVGAPGDRGTLPDSGAARAGPVAAGRIDAGAQEPGDGTGRPRARPGGGAGRAGAGSGLGQAVPGLVGGLRPG